MSGYNHTQPSLLDITRIARSLQTAPVGHTIDYYAAVPSTMPMAYALASRADTRSGTLVIAEEQTAGVGRFQRHWEAPHSQALLVSVILKPPHLPANPAQLPMLAGIAVARAIVSVVPELIEEIGLKWPNDVLLGLDFASGRKVAGILIETAFQREAMAHAVVGMGINVNQSAGSLPAVPPSAPHPTSLREYLGRPVDRSDLLIALSQIWGELIGPNQAGHDIYHEWRNLLYTLGQPVTVRSHAGGNDARTITGVAVDVTPDGELVVVDDLGYTHTLSAGDVTTRSE